MLDRRMLLAAGAAGLTTASAARAQTAPAQTPAPAAPQPSLEERLAARAVENRHRLEFADGRFSGPGWDLLVAEGSKARAFLLGEEHGVAENPMLAGALFNAMRPAGYEVMAIETSPMIAQEMDRAAREGVDGLRRLFADPAAQAAFYGMREEADMLASIVAGRPADRPVLWGLDYDVGADRLAIRKLKAMSKPAAAETALAALEAASTASWAQYEATRGPQHIFNFSGDPALVRAVREAWPDAPDEAAWLLEVMEETLAANRDFGAGRNHASNQRRNDLNKRNLLRYVRAARAEGRDPRMMMKFGASHMVRGLSSTETYDLGNLVPEMAFLDGGHSFHLLVLAGPGRATASFDPSAWTYRPGAPRNNYAYGLDPVAGQAFADAFTVIDVRPLRALVTGSGRAAGLNRELVRAIHGFDAVAVLSGSNPSTNL